MHAGILVHFDGTIFHKSRCSKGDKFLRSNEIKEMWCSKIRKDIKLIGTGTDFPISEILLETHEGGREERPGENVEQSAEEEFNHLEIILGPNLVDGPCAAIKIVRQNSPSNQYW